MTATDCRLLWRVLNLLGFSSAMLVRLDLSWVMNSAWGWLHDQSRILGVAFRPHSPLGYHQVHLDSPPRKHLRGPWRHLLLPPRRPSRHLLVSMATIAHSVRWLVEFIFEVKEVDDKNKRGNYVRIFLYSWHQNKRRNGGNQFIT